MYRLLKIIQSFQSMKGRYGTLSFKERKGIILGQFYATVRHTERSPKLINFNITCRY